MAGISLPIVMRTQDRIDALAALTCLPTQPTPTPGVICIPTSPAETSYYGVSLPRYLPCISPPPAKRTYRIASGANLQTALDTAKRGDLLVLDSAATYAGSFTVRAKPGTSADGWVVLTTSGTLPAPTVRVLPVDSLRLARIASPNTDAAIKLAERASGFAMIGIYATQAANVTAMNTAGIVSLGDGQADSLAKIPSDIIIDRSIVKVGPTQQTRRCINGNATRVAVLNSSVLECHAIGFEAQAFAVWNSPGVLLLRNNHLQAAGENTFIGGADPRIRNLLTCDVTIEGNYIEAPAAWRTSWTAIKNLGEWKQGCRNLYQNNVVRRIWKGAQDGYFLSAKSVNQSGNCPECQVFDLVLRWNWFEDSGAGITLASNPEANPAIPMTRVVVANNLLTKIGCFNGTTPSGRMILFLGRLSYVTIANNTFVQTTPGCSGYNGVVIVGDGMSPLGAAHDNAFTNNLATWGGPYGSIMFTGGVLQGTASLTRMGFANYSGNYLIGLTSTLYTNYYGGTAGQFKVVATPATIFVDPTTGNYRLKSGYPTTLGVPIDSLEARITGVVR